MPRYNPKNKQHRKTLAKRIAKMLEGSGFSVDTSARGEVVYTRAVDGVKAGSAQVRVLTSIVGDQMRQKDKDAIRVCATYTDTAGETRGLVKSTRINRTGDMEAITGRLLEAMRKSYRAASKRANDQGFLALPVKSSKKRWVPRKKKAVSKRSSTVRPTPVVPPPAEEEHRFNKGDLVRAITAVNPGTGIVKESGPGVAAIASVFWLSTGKIERIFASQLTLLTAAR